MEPCSGEAALGREGVDVDLAGRRRPVVPCPIDWTLAPFLWVVPVTPFPGAPKWPLLPRAEV